ncbi:bifunctional DNA-formamidopyrimidine glycosylase/DNA-(apurinic or apyrimidinic site) lyase [Patescibacteria group bacterium]|nr:bifunctional DNA-formamidopyrimidine glycosylase/DNA-(apurinic or apyrimidinic site) lyase [Patescibacteria group bacterium]
MPELPEVETIRRGLAEVLPGKKITTFTVSLKKMYQPAANVPKRLAGRKVISVSRRGKVLMIQLDKDLTLLIHLKMTGQLLYKEPVRIGKTKSEKLVVAGGHPIPTMDGALPSKVTHATFTFNDESKLFYNDLRQFGYLKLVRNEDLGNVPILATFGPEPLEPEFTEKLFEEKLKKRSTTKLKPLLLDQTFIAGLGNIYVDESLNLAKIHPLRTAGSLTKAQRKALYQATKKVLRTSLRVGGTSDNTYVTIRGGKGDYLRRARVYHRTGEPCRTCGTPIRRLVVVGRGTHYCPHCQRAPKTK